MVKTNTATAARVVLVTMQSGETIQMEVTGESKTLIRGNVVDEHGERVYADDGGRMGSCLRVALKEFVVSIEPVSL
jgi:hypothetical protein